MSALKRVEELYLDVLRFIIISVASILLIGAVVFAALAASNLGHQVAKDTQANSTVNPNEVTEGVLASKSNEKAGKTPIRKDVGDDDNTNDPNLALHERTAQAIVAFVNKNGQGIESLAKEGVIEVSKRKANQFKEPATAKEFAEGLAITMEKTLSDPKILKLFEPLPTAPPPPAPAAQSTDTEAVEQASPAVASLRESPIGVVNDTLTTYTKLFNQKVQNRERANEQAITDEIERKATAMTQLYVAGGAFGAFLFLVFISIVVKIERNLRVLTISEKPATESITAAD
jgi:hypothetical protein